MLRSFVCFLLFAAVFFMGMHAADGFNGAGQDRGIRERAFTPAPAHNSTGGATVQDAVQDTEAVPVFADADPLASSEEHFTKKAASFLEGIVEGFYNLVTGLLYNLANVLF